MGLNTANNNYYSKRGAKNPRGCFVIEHHIESQWLYNDNPLYPKLHAFDKQCVSKMKKGKLTKTAALNDFVKLVTVAMKDYEKGSNGRYRITLTQHDKMLVAREIFEDMWENLQVYKPDKVLPKPKRK